MPPIETVKNSSTCSAQRRHKRQKGTPRLHFAKLCSSGGGRRTLGPTPSSGLRTDLDRATPAKKSVRVSSGKVEHGSNEARLCVCVCVCVCVHVLIVAKRTVLLLGDRQACRARDDRHGGLGGDILPEHGRLLLAREADHSLCGLETQFSDTGIKAGPYVNLASI